MLTICYEDTSILAVNKPNNILVHHSSMANNKTDELSLVQLLYNQINQHCFPIHRLDRKTSGIVLFAKKKEDVAKWQHLFITNNIQKEYYGIVRGYAPLKGVIDSPVKGRDAKIHKSALTNYKRLATKELDIPVEPFDTSRYSLLALYPKTGRMHQLRVHLNKISYPLIGDPKYGDRFHNRMFANQLQYSNLFLHAKSLQFIHPDTKQLICVIADFPSDWLQICEKFNWKLD